MIFANIKQISDFFAFPNCRKVGKFGASIERPKTKCFSFKGLCALDLLTRSSAPGPRWELCPQAPVIGALLRSP